MRCYTVNGRKFPSVTSILNATRPQAEADRLEQWRQEVGEDEAERISQQARDRGSELHACCEQVLRGQGEPEAVSELTHPFWQSCRPVLARVSQPQLIERFVHHPQHRYAGTLDAYAALDGEPNYLLDFKTANKPKRADWIQDYFLQAVAYAAAAYRCHGILANGAAVLIALPEDEAQLFKLTRDEMLELWRVWCKRLELFWQRHDPETLEPVAMAEE